MFVRTNLAVATIAIQLCAACGNTGNSTGKYAGTSTNCGDGSCGNDETCTSCPGDCPTCPFCGDGLCKLDESCVSCGQDCGPCPECGDGSCNGTETCATCKLDCGDCVPCGPEVCGPHEYCISSLNACTTRMKSIAMGDFWMGCNENVDADCEESEYPYHLVHLGEYRIDITEVTTAAFAAFLNAKGNNCSEYHLCVQADQNTLHPYLEAAGDGWVVVPIKKQAPLDRVSIEGAESYCRWVGKHLCTEAEWEKAARGGCELYGDCQAESYKYPWGNQEPGPDCSKVQKSGCGSWIDLVGSHPDGQSPYGVLDMAGSLEEIVQDCWRPDYSVAVRMPGDRAVPDACDDRPARGGSSDTPSLGFRNSLRWWTSASRANVGFRCCAAPCGDGECDDSQGENCLGCAEDCGVCASPVDCGECPVGTECSGGECVSLCGNGLCDPVENCAACADDCGACPECGDGSCNGTETCETCADDCGECLDCGECGEREACNGTTGACVGAMVLVPAGMLGMGGICEDPKPYTSYDYSWKAVYLDSFKVDVTEVTVAAYSRCVDSGACKAIEDSDCTEKKETTFGKPGKENHPVTCTDWFQSGTYCQWAGKRLCTSAEWERAGKGDTGWRYPWGSDDLTCDLAVVGWDEEGVDCGHGITEEVASQPAGASWLGVFDLIGNASEWVGDWEGDDPSIINPQGPATGEYRVMRGSHNDCLSSHSGEWPYRTDYWQGIRCCADGTD